MAAITRLDRGQFRVNFESLKRGLLPLPRRLLFTGDMLQVDPQLILESIRRVMDYCELHDGLGRPLVWNEFKVFLSREDHEEFVHMEPVLFAQADELLDGYRKTLGAEVIGDLTLRLLVDDGKELPRRVGVIQVATKINRDLDEAQAQMGEITIRLPTIVPGRVSEPNLVAAPPRPGPPAPTVSASPSSGPTVFGIEETTTGTERVLESAENLTLTWTGGSAAIRPGARWIVGRADRATRGRALHPAPRGKHQNLKSCVLAGGQGRRRHHRPLRSRDGQRRPGQRRTADARRRDLDL